eukprot:8914334-Pyramimonas_sp.AAC.1
MLTGERTYFGRGLSISPHKVALVRVLQQFSHSKELDAIKQYVRRRVRGVERCGEGLKRGGGPPGRCVHPCRCWHSNERHVDALEVPWRQPFGPNVTRAESSVYRRPIPDCMCEIKKETSEGRASLEFHSTFHSP